MSGTTLGCISPPRDGEDIDNCTTPLLSHDPSNLLCAEEWSTQVHIQCAVKFPLIHIQDGCIRFNGSMVDQDINMITVLQHLGNHAFNGHTLGNIEHIPARISTHPLDLADRLI